MYGRTVEDVERIRANVRGLERQKDEMREAVEKTISSRNDSKLGMFRQHASLASSKLSIKEEEVESRLKDLQVSKGESAIRGLGAPHKRLKAIG